MDANNWPIVDVCPTRVQRNASSLLQDLRKRVLFPSDELRAQSYAQTCARIATGNVRFQEVWLQLLAAICCNDQLRLREILNGLPRARQLKVSQSPSCSPLDVDGIDDEEEDLLQSPPVHLKGDMCSNLVFRLPVIGLGIDWNSLPEEWTGDTYRACPGCPKFTGACGQVDFSVWDLVNFTEHLPGISLLHYAVLSGFPGVLEELIKCCDKVSVYSKGQLSLFHRCTPLWLAVATHQPEMAQLLLDAGALPLDGIRVKYDTFPRTFMVPMWAMCGDHTPTCRVLRRYRKRIHASPPHLYEVCIAIKEGLQPMAACMKEFFRWTIGSVDDALSFRLFCIVPQCRSILNLPCHSEEEIRCKQTFCIQLLHHIAQVPLSSYLLPTSTTASDSSSLRIGELVRDLLRHGASPWGWLGASGRELSQQWQQCSKRMCGYSCESLRLHIDKIVTSARTNPSAIHLEYDARALQAGTCFCQLHPSVPAYSENAEEEIRQIIVPCIDNFPFWTRLAHTAAAAHCDDVLKVLFDAGACRQIPSLSCLPLSSSPLRLHDGPSCTCEDVNLLPEQRAIPVGKLFNSNVVLFLQEACRARIIASCHWHGVVPAIRKLPLPPALIDYLLFNAS